MLFDLVLWKHKNEKEFFRLRSFKSLKVKQNMSELLAKSSKYLISFQQKLGVDE